MHDIGSICVYAGSASGNDPRTIELAGALGTHIGSAGMRLVYGGGAVGLMGTLADAALAGGGEVVGVIPRGLFTREVAHRGITELIEVDTMHERKQRMYDLADAFVALPGGLGTLEELAETATWGQLGLHRKPIATLDIDGYWDPLHLLLAQGARRGFVKAENLALIARVTDLDDLFPTLRAYTVPVVEKWITRGQT